MTTDHGISFLAVARLLYASLLPLVSIACLGASNDAPIGGLVESQLAESVWPIVSEKTTSEPRRKVSIAEATSVILGEPERQLLEQEKGAAASPVLGVPTKVGFGRPVPELATNADLHALLKWHDSGSGKVAALRIVSTGALGLRLAILVDAIPFEARLRFFPSNGEGAEEVSGIVIRQLIEANARAGDSSENGRTYWSPVVRGEEVTVEIELPGWIQHESLRIAVPRIVHIFAESGVTPGTIEKATGIGASASCNLDATCYSEWDAQSRSEAWMNYVVDGQAYICTGTLLNDTDTSSQIPYFLSANHCISTQTAASTLNTFWLYRSSACNSGVASPNIVRRSGGATLLYSANFTDTSFLRLNDTLPGGLVLSGWRAALPSLSSDATGVHNPKGDLQKISFGLFTGYSECTRVAGTESFTCTPSSSIGANFVQVVWTQGLVEGGSSGSGIWNTTNGSKYLVGQLYGGSGTCGTSAVAYYGRFDLAYSTALRGYLNPGTASYTLSVSRAGSGSGVVVSSLPGINCGADCTQSYASGTLVTLAAIPDTGSSFSGWSGACTGTGGCVVTMSGPQAVAATFAACSYSLSPTSVSVDAASYSGSFSVFGQSGCTFNAVSNASWVTVTSVSTGVVNYSVAANSGSARTGTISVQGQLFTISQQAGSTSGGIPGSNVIANGSFESGAASWTQVSTNGTVQQIITYDPNGTNYHFIPHSGGYYAWLGGYTPGTDTLYQDVTIPSSATQVSLQFWYAIGSGELPGSSANDKLVVSLNSVSTGATLATLATFSNLNATSGWVQSSAFDLSAFAGQTVRIKFTATNDSSNVTNFFIDDVVLSATSSGTSAGVNYTALWWNPSESGWGLTTDHQGSTIFATLYTYASDGAAMWLVASGLRQQPDGSFTGSLYRTTGPPFYQSPWGTVTAADVGTMTLRFTSATSGTLIYTFQGTSVTKSIQQYVFGTSSTVCSFTTTSRQRAINYQDIWWNPQEAGWGLVLTHQGTTIFATLYTYTTTGRDGWYVASGLARQADGSFAGPLYVTTGPAFNSSPWGVASATSVGTMALRFSDGQTGNLSYSINGTVVSRNISRYTFDSPAAVCQ